MDNITDVLTILIAIYGALLSTHIYMRQRKQDRVYLSVACRKSYNFNSKFDEKDCETLAVTVTNHSFHEVVICSLTLEIPAKNSVLISPWMIQDSNDDSEVSINQGIVKNKENIKIKRGEQFSATYDYKELLELIESFNLKTPLRVRGVCEDTLENCFFSDWIEIGTIDK